MGASDANPLGLALGFADGAALVSMRDRALADGVEVVALDIEIDDVEFPLDVEGGAEEFQKKSTRLRNVEIAIDLAALADRISARLEASESPLSSIRLVPDGGGLSLEGEVVSGKHRAAFAASIVLGPSEPRSLRLFVVDAFVFDWVPSFSTISIPDILEKVIRDLLAGAGGERVAQSVRRTGATSLAFDPVDALLWALMPPSGWKLPAHEQAAVRGVEVTADGKLAFAAGEPLTQRPGPAGPEAIDDAVLFAMAREEAGQIAPDVGGFVAEGDFPSAFRATVGVLDASGGPDVLLERVLALGVADPDLAEETRVLADDELARNEKSIPALLVKAALAAKDGLEEGAVLFYEQAARALRQRGRRRLAGMAFLAASRFRKDLASERVRLLEESIAVRPDDVDALEGLIEELPRLGRTSAAVRAARRLANLGRDPQARARAHVIAGELLRDPLGDAAQAKREYERALKWVPDDGRALEGLACALMDQGEARRAAAILESLIEKAQEAKQRARASHLSLVLGRFWVKRDREAAMTRFRKAHELAPDAMEPLFELAKAAAEAGRGAAAVEAIEDALALVGKVAPPPEKALALFELAGRIYEDQGRTQDAIAQLEAAKELAPPGPDLLAALARLYDVEGNRTARALVLLDQGKLEAEAGDLDEAAELWSQAAVGSSRPSLETLEEYIEAALEKDRSHRRLLDLRVTVAELIGAPGPVVEAIDRRLLVEDTPRERSALLSRMGEALERSGRALEATRAYEEALGLEPKDTQAIAALARIYRSREDRGRLADVLRRAAELTAEAKERASILQERAKLLFDLGRIEEAYDAADAALESQPDDLERLALTTTLAIRMGKQERALELAHRRLSLVRDAADANKLDLYMDLAQIAEALGDDEELASALELAHELAEPNSEVGRQLATRLAKALHAAGRLPELAGLMRRRGRVQTAPAAERAERFIEAARICVQLDDDVQAEKDVEEALQVVTLEGGDPALQRAAFDVLEAIADKHDDPIRRADVMGRRAGAAHDAETREQLRLDQAEILEKAGRYTEAVEALEEAADEFPTSLQIAHRLGRVAEAAGEGPVAAYAYGRAARLAGDADKRDFSVEMHASAARIFSELGETQHALTHDRALLSLVPPGEQPQWMIRSIERLERFARSEVDHRLLVEVLSRKASAAPPLASAELLLEKASVEAQELQDERAALDSLRRARSLAPEGSEVGAAVDRELMRRLEELGLHAELATVLVESAERSDDPARQSECLFRAAQIYEERLEEPQLALSRAQAAVRFDHTNEPARRLRLRLLREVGRPEALVDALAEEAALAQSGDEAAGLWGEAAELLAPRAAVERGESVPAEEMERALQLVRRAATAAPRSAAALFAAAAYTRALGRPGEEFVALGQLVEREISQAERAAAQLRRVELMSTQLDDPMGAQAELASAVAILEKLHPDAPLLEYLPPTTQDKLTKERTPLVSALHWGLELTEVTEDWSTHVRLLMQLVDQADRLEVRAGLRTRAGEVLEWKLGDGEAAEREYLAALAIMPDHEPAKKALRSFYVAVDRFGELAESLGVEALREVWAEVRASGPKNRIIAAAEALWPLLEASGEERADVQLELADLYTDVKSREADVVHVLEQVVKTGPRRHQDAALERLRVLFLEEERFDLYCDVLRRQSERVEKDSDRALAIVELAEALEWKLGDGQAAEREYRAALAIDAACEPARTKLAELLSSQNRFQEIGENLGEQTLRAVLDRLLAQGARDRDRAYAAADALEGLLPALERAPLWLRVAESEDGGDREALEARRAALGRAAAIPGPELVRSLDLLRGTLAELGDREGLSEALQRRVRIEEDDEAKRALLEEIRRGAEAEGDALLIRETIALLADLSQGTPRAALLVELVGRDEGRAEELYREALAAAPGYSEAVEGLRALLERSGRYRDIGEALGADELRRTVEGLRALDDQNGLLPAALALADLLEAEPDRAQERADLLVETASLQQFEGDTEGAEASLKLAIDAAPNHRAAREELRLLLVAQDRLTDLAAVDDALVAETASRAADEGDRDLQIRALSVAAGLKEGESRADTLVLVAALERGRDRASEAEGCLRAALEAAPDHAMARAELETLLWSQGRFVELVAVLGPGAIVQRSHAEIGRAPEIVYQALEDVRSRLPDELAAESFELTAEIVRQGVDADAEWRRRMDHLEAARGLWDELSRVEGQERVRMGIVDLWRARGDDAQLLEALEDALDHARDPESRGELAVERSTLLARAGRRNEALELVEPLLKDERLSAAHRVRAARLLVDELVIGDLDGLPLPSLDLKMRALALLTDEANDAPRDARKAWLMMLAEAREILGEEDEAIAAPLEAALDLMDGQEQLRVRRRLRGLYEELGDWAQAERHASVIAEADGDPGLWVGLSELRVWLDDREGAERALESALEKNSAEAEAHEALLRLAEQAGETGKVVDRLVAWADADSGGNRRARAERLLKASWLSLTNEPERAALLAERAVDLIPTRHDALLPIGSESLEVLSSLDQKPAMMAVLTRLVSELPSNARGSELRVKLADLLLAEGRDEEAHTVIEQGIHRDTPESDPLVLRLIEDARRDGSERAARQLLSTAERLGSGPAARRLRVVGAEVSERAGDDQTARAAWSTLVSELGTSGEEGARARAALVRMNRKLGDKRALLDALLEAAEDAEPGETRARLLVEAAEIAKNELSDDARAESLLKRAMHESPEDQETGDLLLQVLQNHSRWMDLDAALAERARTLEGEELAEVLARRAEIARSEIRDEHRAAELLVDAYRAAPSLARGRAAAEAAHRSGSLLDAARLVEEILAADLGGDARTLVHLELLRVSALDGAGQEEEAVAGLEALGERMPGSALVRARRFELLSRYGRWRQLATALERSSSTVDLGTSLRYRLAAARLLLERVDDRQGAERALRDTVRMVEGWLAEPDVVIPEQLGWGPGDDEAAPTHGSPLLDLAAMALELGNHALRVDALRLYAQSLPAGPGQWRALLSLASAEREAGDLDAAEFTLRGVVDAVRTSKQVSPRDRVEAERSLGALLLDRDNPKDAAEALSRAVGLFDESGEEDQAARAQVLVQLSEAYRAMGEPKQALEAMSEARTLAPEVVPESSYERAIEAAGPSEALALLLERRAASAEGSTERAAVLREAARIWDAIGRRARAFAPLLSAYGEDPSNVEEAKRLHELLYRSDRWGDLERHIARRLEVEDLSGQERARLIAERGRILATHLGRNRIALELLEQARAIQPTSIELLEDIARQAAAMGDQRVQEDALARLATVAASGAAKRRALVERALILESRGELSGAAQCLEEVLGLVERKQLRAVAERMVQLHMIRDDPEAAASVWIRCATRGDGEEKAAAFARAAQLRLDRLGDSRGAVAAFDAAARAAPQDVGLRRAVIDLARSIGDAKKAREHAKAVVDIADEVGMREVRTLHLLEVARSSASLGDVDEEVASYHAALETRPATQALLDELVARTRAVLPPERIAAMLQDKIDGMEPGLVRGRHRLALARILEEPLGRHWEAQGQREEAAKVDFEGVDDAPDVRSDSGPDGERVDENYRVLRSMLDRSGRWTELAELETRRAVQLDNPVAQADALSEVGCLYMDHLPADWPDRLFDEDVQVGLRNARDALYRAVDADPDHVGALSRLARIELGCAAWDRAEPVFRRLERLGGPSWPPPEFEVAAARVAQANGDVNLACSRALAARERDPGSLTALRILADLCDRVEDAEDRETWIDELVDRLDPVLDAAEMASLLVRRAEIAKEKGQADLAAQRLERALVLRPEDAAARRLHRELMEASGASRALVDFLEREALRSEAADARASLLAALSVATAGAEERRSIRIAEKLERFLEDAEVADRLIQFYAGIGEGDALLRLAEGLGGIRSLGELAPDARTRLAAACFRAGRHEDGFRLLNSFLPDGELAALERADLSEFDRRVSEAALRSGERWELKKDDILSVRAPRIVYRLRPLLLAMDPPASMSPAAIRWLEGVCAASGGQDLFARPLADVYRVQGSGVETAARIYRRLLARDPTDLSLVESLFQVLGGEAANGEALGARSVRALFSSGAEDRSESFAPMTQRPDEATVRARLLHEVVTTPIGMLLATTALPLSAVLPGKEARRELMPADVDRRISAAVQALQKVSRIPREVWLDPDGGEWVTIEPGNPPRIVVGEALAEDASPAELRFHVGRAAMLLELGFLLAERTGGTARQRYLCMLLAVAKPDAGILVASELEPAREAILEQLSEEERQVLAALPLPSSGGPGGPEIELEPWMKSVLSAADRFGLLVAGELSAALRGLRRSEPRTLGEPFVTREDRIASVRRWRPASDLIAFVLSEDFAEVARVASDPEAVRF